MQTISGNSPTAKSVAPVLRRSVASLIRSVLPDLELAIQDLKLGRRYRGSPRKDWRSYRGPAVLTAEQWTFWRENGYLVLPQFFGQYRVNEANALIDRLWAERRRPNNPLVADVFFSPTGGSRMHFGDAPDEARAHPYKLMDMYLESDFILDLCLEPRLCQVLAELLDGDPMVCNTLSFEKGSQQEFHFDTFYMPAPVENKMVASWIALEDVHPDAGPLKYYPGSHRIPPYRFSDGKLNAIGAELPQFRQYIEGEIEKRQLQPASFAAKAGDVLIWHSQLYHGGCEIRDPGRTRKSLVTHYFRAMDFPEDACISIGPGRNYLKREHQRVP